MKSVRRRGKMRQEWLLEKAQALVKSANETEDPAARAVMIDTAAEMMKRFFPEPEEPDDDE
jgi:hypothetical protein